MINIAKPYLTKDEAKAAYETILSGWVTQGTKVQEFEEKFAEYVGSKYAVAVSSCTAALHLALIVAGIKEGDEVICPSLSFIATANSIKYVGANPVFADVDPLTYNIDPMKTEKLIGPKTRAILIVHQMGISADIDAFKKICERYRLKLVEDAACAIGSVYKGKRIGGHSDLVCFSFHPRKIITTGDGGMIATSNKKYYIRLKQLRQHGMSVDDLKRHTVKKIIFEKYKGLGYNYRMTDIQAAVGIEQLKKINKLIIERRIIAEFYITALKKIKFLQFPSTTYSSLFNYQSFCVLLDKHSPISRNRLMEELLNKGIATRRGIMMSHKEGIYRLLPNKPFLPVSEELSKRSILLPIYVPMKKEDIVFITRTLIEIFQKHYG